MLVHSNELNLWCTLSGPEDGLAVVFVHGLAASSAVWDEQARRFAVRHRVVQYDLRSHGGSDAVATPCTRSDLVADLVGLLDGLNIERAVLVGHSAGGVVAMQTAIEAPRRVAGLVLVGTASECNDKTAAWYRKTADQAIREGGESAMKAMGVKPGSGTAPDGSGLAHLARAMATLNQWPLTERLGAVPAPTLIIVGENDFLGVGGSVIVNRAMPQSQLKIVPGRGHGIYVEDPDWFASRVLDFVATIEGRE